MMRSILFMASALTALVCHDAAAQSVRRANDITITRGSFAVAPYAGYLLSQEFIDGPLGAALNVQSAPIYGVQASLPLAPSASLVGTFGYSSGELRAGIPLIGGINFGETSTAVFDASVELRMQTRGTFMPVVQLGGGATRREVRVAGFSASTTDFQVSGGIGADIPLSSNIALRVLARDYYGKADFGSVGPFEAKTNDLHAVSLTGGLRIAF